MLEPGAFRHIVQSDRCPGRLLLVTAPVYCGRDLFAQLLAAFVTPVRSGDRDEVLRFYAVVERMRRVCQDEEMRGSLGMLLATPASTKKQQRATRALHRRSAH